jgi:LysR family transcriptional regulator, hypochlorite-specific transcription factor HypT
MNLKRLEDFITLAHTRSFSKAAQLRGITHPAFGRGIKDLEAWVGAPLISRGSSPLQLTGLGEEFLETARQTVANLNGAKDRAQQAKTQQIRISTGRTLARTVVADWISHQFKCLTQNTNQKSAVANITFKVTTGSLNQAALDLETSKSQFMAAYHHPSLDLKLDARRFRFKTLGKDKLVPVATEQFIKASKNQQPLNFLQFEKTLALRRVFDESAELLGPSIPILRTVVDCDSPDAVHALALKGMGVAWLPWSLVVADHKQKRLVIIGENRWQMPFDIRLYRKRPRLSETAEEAWEGTEEIC